MADNTMRSFTAAQFTRFTNEVDQAFTDRMMRIHAQARTLKAAPLTQRELEDVDWES
jgi:hypothetical protein